jgi:hypothetical protein
MTYPHILKYREAVCFDNVKVVRPFSFPEVLFEILPCMNGGKSLDSQSDVASREML